MRSGVRGMGALVASALVAGALVAVGVAVSSGGSAAAQTEESPVLGRVRD